MRMGQFAYKVHPQSETLVEAVSRKTENLLFRIFGGISWLIIAIGTIVVAIGYLGLIDSIDSYSSDPVDSLRTIGYGLVIYGIAAIFVALNRFFKSR